jgi:thiol:disulfide interchange protein DsbC
LTVNNCLLRAAAAFAMLAFASYAPANEAQIRKALESKLGTNAIEGISRAPVPGLWEIRLRTSAGPEIIYSDSSGTYVIQGNIFDASTGRDLTEERLRKLSAIKFEALPLDQAVKVQRGDGRRVLAMFSDPYCPYCQQFEKNLQQIDDITVYVFMYPVIRPQNADHSKAVWCSPDRAKAWLELAIDHKRPAAAPGCDNPVEKNVQLGRSLRVNSTPTLILANGERLSGGLSAAALQELLDKVLAQARKSR